MHFTFLNIEVGPRALAPEEVHVWCAPLQRVCDPAWLTASEREKAARFRMERVRNQFIAARAQVRLLLGGYLGCAPAEVPITYEINGKPILDPTRAAGWYFNVSHSETLALFAVTRLGRVGVDVERYRAIPDAEALVERFFTSRERDLFLRLPAEERLPAFFRAWTRKEAVLKAIGSGVQALDRCDVTFGKDEPAEVLRMGEDEGAACRWVLKGWQPATGYDAAIAVEVELNTSRGQA